MSRFCGGERGADTFKVAHFAQHNYVGVLTKRGAECARIIACVAPDFPLRDHATVGRISIFDRVFNCDDVRRNDAVEIIDDACERCRFTASRRSRNKNESAFFDRKIFQNFGNAQRAEVADFIDYATNGYRKSVEVAIYVAPEPSVADGKRTVHVGIQVEFGHLFFGKNVLNERKNLLFCENGVVDLFQRPGNPCDCTFAGLDVNVGSVDSFGKFEVFDKRVISHK